MPHPAEPAWSPDDILPEPEDAAGEQQIELFAALAEHLPGGGPRHLALTRLHPPSDAG